MRTLEEWRRVAKNYKWLNFTKSRLIKSRLKRCDRERFSSHWSLSRAEFSRKAC